MEHEVQFRPVDVAVAVSATALGAAVVGIRRAASALDPVARTLLRVGQDEARGWLLGGGLMTVLGIVFLRQTEAAAVTITSVTGALWAITGIVRLSAAYHHPKQRLSLVLGGLVSLVLGLIVLFNLVDASYKLLGILLGIQVVAEGLAVMVFGREARRDRYPADEETTFPGMTVSPERGDDRRPCAVLA